MIAITQKTINKVKEMPLALPKIDVTVKACSQGRGDKIYWRPKVNINVSSDKPFNFYTDYSRSESKVFIVFSDRHPSSLNSGGTVRIIDLRTAMKSINLPKNHKNLLIRECERLNKKMGLEFFFCSYRSQVGDMRAEIDHSDYISSPSVVVQFPRKLWFSSYYALKLKLDRASSSWDGSLYVGDKKARRIFSFYKLKFLENVAQILTLAFSLAYFIDAWAEPEPEIIVAATSDPVKATAVKAKKENKKTQRESWV